MVLSWQRWMKCLEEQEKSQQRVGNGGEHLAIIEYRRKSEPKGDTTPSPAILASLSTAPDWDAMTKELLSKFQAQLQETLKQQHWEQQPFARGAHQAPRLAPKPRSNATVCYGCPQPGHFASECPSTAACFRYYGYLFSDHFRQR